MTEAIVSRALSVKAVRAETRQADFVASTDTIDSYGESVVQNWKLDRYRGNPVVLYAHDSRSLPIGTADTRMVNGNLECTITFASADANPQAESVFKLIQERCLRAVSVGFIPHTVRYEMRDDVEVCCLDDNELLEISVVPIPANPDALGKMKQRAKSARTETQTMDVKELETRAVAAEEKAKAADITIKALETANATLVAERDAALKDVAAKQVELDALHASERAAQDALVEREVDALIGVKLIPAEKEPMLELAKANRSLFDKLVAQRPDLKLLGASPITPEPTQENTAASEPTGDDLAAEVSKVAAS